MSKLLSANFIRLKKDKFFWSGLVFMLAAGIFFPVMRYMDMRQTQTINRIDIFKMLASECIFYEFFLSAL